MFLVKLFDMNFTYNQTQIKQLLKKIHIKSDFDLVLMLAKKMREDYVYNTSALEGNTMTYPEVQTLLEGITVGGHKLSEERQVLNQNKSWLILLELVKEKSFVLDKKTFCQLDAKVAKEEALTWGEFRTKMVGIGGTEHKPPHAEELDQVFTESVEEIEKVKNPLLKGLLFFLTGSLNQFFLMVTKELHV